MEMADLDSLVVRCAVPEAQAGAVKPGMQAEIGLDALPGVTLSAGVVRVYPELDPRMRTRTVELAVKDDANLAPGMFGRVRLIVESVADAVAVPVQAVVVTPAGGGGFHRRRG
ncbi:efflux RND transporter periplasmic adaptor subunit [bacterium]|nr:efflux RND transporter periplasmic adaptor subunit [bacterium]